MHRNWLRYSKKAEPRSLLFVLFATFWKDYAKLSLICFFTDVVFRLAQPFLLGYLLEFFRQSTKTTYYEAVMFAVGIIALNGMVALFSNHVLLLSFHNGMKVRVAVCSLIYRKVSSLTTPTNLNDK